MAVLLFTYDLHKPKKDYEKLYELIKSNGYAKLSESSYAIITEDSASEYYDKVKPLVDSDDRFYIIPLGKPYAGYGPKKINGWLEENL